MTKILPKIHSSFAILVLSCDKYSDLWKPFFSQFHKQWPTCPYTVYLGSNTVGIHDPSVVSLLSKTKRDWSTDLLAILQQIQEEYIFIWLEDLFPIEKIDEELFIHSFQFIKTKRGNHIHIAPRILPDRICEDTMFGSYEKGVPYRVTVPGFWNTQYLRQLLLPGEDPWKFEIQGSYRSSYSDGFYTVNSPIFQFIRVVDKGKIRREAYTYCIKNGIKLDTHKRSIFSIYETAKGIASGYIFLSVLTVPWRIRVHFMDTLRRLLVSY
jgi:hypothetical protein